MKSNSPVTDSNLNPQERKRILRILEGNWQAEMRGHETYAALAGRETDPQRSSAFRTLADAEQRHADLWAERHTALGGSPLTYGGPKTGEADNLANRIGGINIALRRLELDETQDIAKYAKQVEDIGDQPTIVKNRRRHDVGLHGRISAGKNRLTVRQSRHHASQFVHRIRHGVSGYPAEAWSQVRGRWQSRLLGRAFCRH